jgi:hypothetical protein
LDLAQKILEIYPIMEPGPNLEREAAARQHSNIWMKEFTDQFVDIVMTGKQLFG